MLVNQPIPLQQRHAIKKLGEEVFWGEDEYEFNEVLLLKKVAALFVALSTGKEPTTEQELQNVCQDWSDDNLINWQSLGRNVPREEELQLLLNEATKIVSSFTDK